MGKLKEAESFNQKALEIDPQFTDAYFSLSTMHASDSNKKWHNQLFSEKILKNKNDRELVNIFLQDRTFYTEKAAMKKVQKTLLLQIISNLECINLKQIY